MNDAPRATPSGEHSEAVGGPLTLAQLQATGTEVVGSDGQKVGHLGEVGDADFVVERTFKRDLCASRSAGPRRSRPTAGWCSTTRRRTRRTWAAPIPRTRGTPPPTSPRPPNADEKGEPDESGFLRSPERRPSCGGCQGKPKPSTTWVWPPGSAGRCSDWSPSTRP